MTAPAPGCTDTFGPACARCPVRGCRATVKPIADAVRALPLHDTTGSEVTMLVNLLQQFAFADSAPREPLRLVVTE